MRNWRLVGSSLILTLLLSGCAQSPKIPSPRTVASLDLSRYLGVWHEVARYPNSFQEGCSRATATYSLNDDGTIRVVNECVKADGTLDRAVGKAWSAGDASSPKLKVRFFWPFTGDYWVIDLGKGYEYSVVSEPSRKYLWILSRDREMDAKLLGEILDRLKNDGFDASRLIFEESPAKRR